MMIRFAGLILGTLVLSGCATNSENVVSPQKFMQSRAVQLEARTLSPGDELELSVEVNGKKEIPQSIMELNYEGDLLAPLIGDVNLQHKTLAEARILLETKYSIIFVGTPMITLRMASETAGEWGYVTVLGQVRNPGRFPITRSVGMNLTDAIHEAGGFGESADFNDIIVTGKNADGEVMQCVCDIAQFGRANSDHQDVVLFNDDTVYVPERLF